MEIDNNKLEALKALGVSKNLIEIISSTLEEDPATALKLLSRLAASNEELTQSIDTEGLEKLIGKTPKAGEDFYTDTEIQAMQDFLQANVTNLGADLTEQLQATLDDYDTIVADTVAKVDAKLATVKDGKKGETGEQGKDGKDGSPDTGEEILEKIKPVRGAKRLGFEHVKGLKNLQVRVINNTDDIDQLKKDVKKDIKAFIGNNSSSTSGASAINDLSDVNITALANGEVLVYNSGSGMWENQALGGGGDMLKATYDTDLSGVVDNAESAEALTGVQATAITANTAKVTNATHTGDVTGSTALTIASTAISGKTSVAALAGTEEVLVNEAGTLKKTTAQDIADLGGGGDLVDDLTPQLGGTLDTNSKAINESKGADIASATTTDIGAATGNFVDVTGTTTITGLGTVQAGTRRVVQFDGILTLTHNATSLILPTGANVDTAAGDTATFISLGSGNWICTSYMRADGTALASAGGGGVSEIFSVELSTFQNLTTAATIAQFDTELYDAGSNFATGTYKFTAPSDGEYFFSYTLVFHGLTAGDRAISGLYKNTTQVAHTEGHPSSTAMSFAANKGISLTAGDTVEVRVQNVTAARGFIQVGDDSCFQGFKLA